MNNIFSSTIILMLLTIISKIFGFMRDITLTYVYGASMISDIYIVSSSIPGTLFSLVTVALSTIFIPFFYDLDKISKKKSLKFTNNIINISIAISIVMTFIGFVFIDKLVKLFAINFSADELELAIKFTKILILGLIFIGLSNIMTALLQVNNNFIVPGIVGIPYNIIIILSIIVSDSIDPIFMVYGTLIALIAQFLFQLPFVFSTGYKYHFYINLKEDYMKKILTIITPVVIGVCVNQVNFIIDRSLASTLNEGFITILDTANKLNNFATGIFIGAISSVIYPYLSNYNNHDKFKKIIFDSINIVIILMIPIFVYIIVLADPIVKIIFYRGAFSLESVNLTAIALRFYSLGILAIALREILNKIFYSIQDTKTPMKNGIFAISLNIFLNIILIEHFGYTGLAFATSISTWICTLFLFISLNKKIGDFGQSILFKTYIKSLIAAILMGILVYFLYKLGIYILGVTFINEVFVIIISVFIGALMYIKLLELFKVSGVSIILRKIKLLFN